MQRILAVLAIAMSGAVSAEAQAQGAPISVHAKSLGEALVDLAVQARISIATPRGGFGAARSSPVQGALPVRDALRTLLDGTGYTFEQVDAVSFRIVLAPVQPHPAEQVSSADVIVTAARRPNTLDRLAFAATAIDSEILRRTGARQTADIGFSAAGMTVTNLGPGRNKILMRGLSDGAFSGRTQSTVGVYLDDARVTYSAPDPDLQLVDIEAVELLRGPQGALYGAGPISGVYRVSTKAPDISSYSAMVSASAEQIESGGFGSNLEGVLNVPITSANAGLRIVGYQQKSGGWLDNTRLARENTNSFTRTGGRVSGLARIGDTWAVNLRLASQRIDAADSDYIDLAVRDAGRTARLLEPHAANFVLASIGARGAAMGGEVAATSSYTVHRLNERYDAAVGAVVVGVPRGTPLAYDNGTNVKLAVHELRYSSVASQLPWSVGVFYSDQIKRTNAAFIAAPDTPGVFAAYRSERKDLLQEYAVYGQIAYNLGFKTQISVSGRYFWTDLSTISRAIGFPSDRFNGDRHESGLAPRAEVSFAPTPNAFFYVSAAEGYRSGGFNTGYAGLLAAAGQPNRVYSGDSLWSYETGVKQAFDDGKIRTRTALFLQNWRGAQSDQLVASGLPFTGNIGDAQSYGVETELAAQLTKALQVRAHASLTHTEVIDADPTFPSRPRSGLPGAPKILTGGMALYEHPLNETWRVQGMAQFQYVGKSNITYSRQRELRVGGYADVGLQLGLAAKDWTAALSVKNLFDAGERTFSYGNPLRLGGAGIVTPRTPRAVGVELRKTF